jgi:hypothetical protein
MAADRGFYDELNLALESLPGVSIHGVYVTSTRSSLVLTIEKIVSVGPIVYAAVGANLRVSVWSDAPGIPILSRGSPAFVRWGYLVTDSEDNAVERFKDFGAYILRYLYAVSAISPDLADQLALSWNTPTQ